MLQRSAAFSLVMGEHVGWAILLVVVRLLLCPRTRRQTALGSQGMRGGDVAWGQRQRQSGPLASRTLS